MKLKIAFFSAHKFDKEFFNLYNVYNYQYSYFDCSVDEETIKLAINYDAICVFANDKVNINVIRTLSELGIRLIALRTAGFNNIDLAAAKAYNVIVVRVPEYSPHAVAEHAVAMLLTLNRKIHKAYIQVQENNFLLDNLLGFDLYKKNVGVIGGGRVGSAFIKIMLGFGCSVFVYDPVVNQEVIALGANYVDLKTLLTISDIISLHCPLNENTFHIINSDSINLMKQGVFIINTARGGIIDTVAAKEGILNNKIGYLALDVYEHEENIFFHDLRKTTINDKLLLELIKHPHVLITSHQGFFTNEALNAIAKTTTENINNFFQGKTTNQITII